jgi:cyclin-dependent kinase 8/11
MLFFFQYLKSVTGVVELSSQLNAAKAHRSWNSIPWRAACCQHTITLRSAILETTSTPLLSAMPEYPNLQQVAMHNPSVNRPHSIEKWYRNTVNNNNYPPNIGGPSESALDLIKKLLEYDPLKRLSAEEALRHPYFTGDDGKGPLPSWNCFEGLEHRYPARKVSNETHEIGGTGSLPVSAGVGAKRSGMPDDGLLRPPVHKKMREG